MNVLVVKKCVFSLLFSATFDGQLFEDTMLNADKFRKFVQDWTFTRNERKLQKAISSGIIDRTPFPEHITQGQSRLKELKERLHELISETESRVYSESGLDVP
jgi:hypothetical protein